MSDFHVLTIVVREAHDSRDHVFIWNLLTLHLQFLLSASKLLTAATVTAQQVFTVRHRLVKAWGTAPGHHLPSSPTSPTSPRLISNGSWSPRSSSSSFFQQSNDARATSPIDMDDEEEEEEDGHMDEGASQNRVRLQGNQRQLLILGHRNNWMSIYKFSVSRSGQVTCAKASSARDRGNGFTE